MHPETKKASNAIDHLTLIFFGLFSGGLGKRIREEQYRKNKEEWKKYSKRQHGRMLEDQSELSAFSYGKTGRLWEKVFLGGKTLNAAVNSCEVIAVYNALCALNDPCDFPDLLRSFSHCGICANGLFGTSPGSVERFFKERGYHITAGIGHGITRESMEETEKQAMVCILNSFNRGQNPFSMVHTMCVTKEKNCWRLHNDGEGGKTYPTLYDAVSGYNGGKSHPIKVIGVSRE